jgi:hypothetical protein
MTGEVRRVVLLALAAALLGVLLGCGALVPYCDDGIACARGADGVWRCPPPGGMVCRDGEVHSSCVDHGGDYCRVRY